MSQCANDRQPIASHTSHAYKMIVLYKAASFALYKIDQTFCLLAIKVIAHLSWGKIIFALIKTRADNPAIAAVIQTLCRQAIAIPR
jgi:hypothetical protein